MKVSVFALGAMLLLSAQGSVVFADQSRPREYQPSAEQSESRGVFGAIGSMGKKIGGWFKRDHADQLPLPPPDQGSGASSTQANLTGVVSDVSVNGNKMKFKLTVKNSGAVRASGTMRIKPFLMPVNAGKRGVVLDWKEYQIDLDSQASISVNYDVAMPLVKRDQYYISVVVNSKATIFESSQLDNATDLVDAGTVEVTQAAPLAADSEVGDLITNPGESMEISQGVIRHPLQTISYGRQSEPTVRGAASARLSGRFMMANVSTRKVYTVPYNQFSESKPEKAWYSLIWPSERVPSGYRYVDTYSQRTIVDGLPPGNYRYLTMINSHDDVTETNPYNDLDIREVSISAARTEAPEVWVVAPNRQAPATNVTYKSDFGRATLSAPAIGQSNGWLRVAGNSGSAFATGLFSLEANPTDLAEAMYSNDVVIPSILSNAEFYGAPNAVDGKIKVRYFVQGAQPPAMSIDQSVIDIRGAYADVAAEGGRKTLTVRNTGQSTLQWMAYFSQDGARPNWISVTPSQGSVEPGESMQITLQADPEVVRQGYSSSASLKFLTNVPKASSLGSQAATPSVQLNFSVLRVF